MAAFRKLRTAEDIRHIDGGRELSGIEWRVVHLAADGHTAQSIGRIIGRTEYAIKEVIRSLFNKVGVWSRVELALWYVARQHQNQMEAV